MLPPPLRHRTRILGTKKQRATKVASAVALARQKLAGAPEGIGVGEGTVSIAQPGVFGSCDAVIQNDVGLSVASVVRQAHRRKPGLNMSGVNVNPPAPSLMPVGFIGEDRGCAPVFTVEVEFVAPSMTVTLLLPELAT